MVRKQFTLKAGQWSWEACHCNCKVDRVNARETQFRQACNWNKYDSLEWSWLSGAIFLFSGVTFLLPTPRVALICPGSWWEVPPGGGCYHWKPFSDPTHPPSLNQHFPSQKPFQGHRSPFEKGGKASCAKVAPTQKQTWSHLFFFARGFFSSLPVRESLENVDKVWLNLNPWHQGKDRKR